MLRPGDERSAGAQIWDARDRKSTRLNSSHPSISYAVFCLKKKNERAALIAYLVPIAVPMTSSRLGSTPGCDYKTFKPAITSRYALSRSGYLKSTRLNSSHV